MRLFSSTVVTFWFVVISVISVIAVARTTTSGGEAKGKGDGSRQQTTTTYNNDYDDEVKAARLLCESMSLDEKLSLVHGTEYLRSGYVGKLASIDRLGIPSLKLNDGPQGFRGKDGTSTQWPCALSMAATWDVRLIEKWGVAMGREFRDKGAAVFLGPGVNVVRIPQNGRNFEYLSGEDPVLGSKLVSAQIPALQDQGIIANIKHYVNNNQETDRGKADSIVDERTRWELYMPPFEAAVKAGILSVMCSYNKINGQYACENTDTIGDLKQKLGFQGFVVTDWFASHSLVNATKAGLDMEMPMANHYGRKLKRAILKNQIPMTILDDMVSRVLVAMIVSGNIDNPPKGNSKANVTSEEHNQLARELASAGIILLKNDDGFLPLMKKSDTNIRSIAVIGEIIPSGGGSGHVQGPYVISGAEGIRQKCKSRSNDKYDDEDLDDGRRQQQQHCSVIVSSMKNPNYNYAKQADIVVIFTSTTSHEGSDRSTLSFPAKDIDVIDHLIAMDNGDVARKMIVIGTAPGAALFPFADDIPAVLLSFMPGQEGGNAIADILFGDANPSGKLPVTIPNVDNETQLSPSQYPGIHLVANYSEQLLTGYRWYDANGATPKYPFGFGLSYTKFAYKSLQIDDDGHSIKFQLSNVGTTDGAEISQLYLSFPPDAKEPPKLLKDYTKTFLPTGKSKSISLTLTDRDYSIWNTTMKDWQLIRGVFIIKVGSSSSHLPLQASVDTSKYAS